MRKNTIPVRSDPEFKKLIEGIRLERFRNGKDKKPLTTSRMTLAITRIPNIKKILGESRIDEK